MPDYFNCNKNALIKLYTYSRQFPLYNLLHSTCSFSSKEFVLSVKIHKLPYVQVNNCERMIDNSRINGIKSSPVIP